MDAYIKRRAEQLLHRWLKSSKVLLLLGPRQAGKTTLLKRFFQSRRTTYLNFDVETEKDAFFRAAPLAPPDATVSLGDPEILMIDEAQRQPDVSRIIKGWYDSGVKTKIILSGSSSLDLLDRSAESLTGRNVKIFLPPLTFREIVESQRWYHPSLFLGAGKPFSEQLDSLLFTSLVFGSYPETVTTVDKMTYISELVSDYLLKDIYHLGLVKDPDVIRRLLALLAHQSGSLVSINELANALSVSRVTVERYLDLLERTFVIFRLPAWSSNPRKEISKNHKVFFWDTGVRNALIGEMNTNPLRSDIGQLWENWVIAEFAKRNWLEGQVNRLFFWRSHTGGEVDLVIKNSVTGTLAAYEIKWSPGKPTRAFTTRYRIPVSVIHRGNVMGYLLANEWRPGEVHS